MLLSFRELALDFATRKLPIRPFSTTAGTGAVQIRCPSLHNGWGLVLEPLLLLFQQLAEFFDQFEKTVMVLFLLNQCAQLVQAFALVWSHRGNGMIQSRLAVDRGRTQFPVETYPNSIRESGEPQ
jgi:hypothetical protein